MMKKKIGMARVLIGLLLLGGNGLWADPVPAGMSEKYAAPFGILAWNGSQWQHQGVDARYVDDGQPGVIHIQVAMVLNTTQQVDDLGQAYAAKLTFQNLFQSSNNGQYYVYTQSGGRLSLRVIAGTAGSAAFAELNNGVLQPWGGDHYFSPFAAFYPGNAYTSRLEWPRSERLDFAGVASETPWRASSVTEGGLMCFGAFYCEMDSWGGSAVFLKADGSLELQWDLGLGWGTTLLVKTRATITPSSQGYVTSAGVSVLTWNPTIGLWKGVDGLYLQINPAGSTFWGKLVAFAANQGSVFDVSKDSAGFITLHHVNGPQSGWLVNGAVLLPDALSYLASTASSPIQTFEYNGHSYTAQGGRPSANGTAWITTYANGSGGTAEVEWTIATRAVAKISVTTSAGVAIYTNGSAVGRPGGYVLDAVHSTAANALTGVNGIYYTVSGNYTDPLQGLFAGDLDVTGNVFSLGSWITDANRAGVVLTYQDGFSSTSPALVKWTASRFHAGWLWEKTGSSGSGTQPMMRLDSDNKLTLYDGVGTGLTPGIVLDPSPNGTSRFEGRVRIAPKGDLSMGEFIQEPP